MSQPKTYAPGSAKLRTNCQWFELSYSFNAEKMIEFIQRHTNSRGFVNLKINERRGVGKFGDTHSVSLDPWEPKSDGQPQARTAAPAPEQDGGQSDVPF